MNQIDELAELSIAVDAGQAKLDAVRHLNRGN
jgi:hypothetical protein